MSRKNQALLPAEPGIHVLPGDFQQVAVRVDLVGCGGTGSQVLTGLARLHVALKALGHPHGFDVWAYDPDTVSAANVGRQLFSSADIGRSKAAVLIHRLNCFLGLTWKSMPTRYTTEYIERPYSTRIVISCVDTAKARREIAATMDSLKQGVAPTYWLDCGNKQSRGQVFLTQRPVNLYTRMEEGQAPLRLPLLEDILPEIFDPSIPEDDKPSCSLAEALESQNLFINQHVATWACELLWRLFRDGQITTHGYWINPLTGSIGAVPVPAAAVKRVVAGTRCKAGTNG